jgi:hypothetical protein
VNQLKTSISQLDSKSVPVLFIYPDISKLRNLLDMAKQALWSCGNATALDISVEWTRALLSLPSAGAPAAAPAASADEASAALVAFRGLVIKARYAHDHRTALVAGQVLEALKGDLPGLSARLSEALSNDDVGSAVSLADVSAALAARRLIITKDYAGAVRMLEQVQEALRAHGFLYHSTNALEALVAIFHAYAQTLPRAASMTELVQRIKEFMSCDKELRFARDGKCYWPKPDYLQAVHSNFFETSLLRLVAMSGLALESQNVSWVRKINGDRAALSRLPDLRSTRDADEALLEVSQYVETVTSIQRLDTCLGRQKLVDKLYHEGLHWTDEWEARKSDANAEQIVTSYKAYFAHCDKKSDKAFRNLLEQFDIDGVVSGQYTAASKDLVNRVTGAACTSGQLT